MVLKAAVAKLTACIKLFTLRASRRGPFVLSFLRQVDLNKSAPKHRTRKISEKLFEAGGSELSAPKLGILANSQRSSLRQVGLSWVLQSTEFSQICSKFAEKLFEASWLFFCCCDFLFRKKRSRCFCPFWKEKKQYPALVSGHSQCNV